jgi:hypothetical protein
VEGPGVKAVRPPEQHLAPAAAQEQLVPRGTTPWPAGCLQGTNNMPQPQHAQQQQVSASNSVCFHAAHAALRDVQPSAGRVGSGWMRIPWFSVA